MCGLLCKDVWVASDSKWNYNNIYKKDTIGMSCKGIRMLPVWSLWVNRIIVNCFHPVIWMYNHSPSLSQAEGAGMCSLAVCCQIMSSAMNQVWVTNTIPPPSSTHWLGHPEISHTAFNVIVKYDSSFKRCYVQLKEMNGFVRLWRSVDL